jgi:NADPH:quinone reductase-like Zn-dependent oxidoreductase
MRVAGVEHRDGPVETLEVAEPRAADEVLIEMKTAGVGNWDGIVRTGDWDLGRVPPMALGVEAAGVVAGWVPRSTTGLSATRAHPSGPAGRSGNLGAVVDRPSETADAKPAGMSWAQAGAFRCRD